MYVKVFQTSSSGIGWIIKKGVQRWSKMTVKIFIFDYISINIEIITKIRQAKNISR